MNDNSKADYYRMTGERYKPSIHSLLNVLYANQIRYMIWWRMANKKRGGIWQNWYYIGIAENTVWRFR